MTESQLFSFPPPLPPSLPALDLQPDPSQHRTLPLPTQNTTTLSSGQDVIESSL